jgi:hypothetical protein
MRELNYFVSPNGNDEHNGRLPEYKAGLDNINADDVYNYYLESAAGPFRTIERAIEELRRLKNRNIAFSKINVYLRDGTYVIKRPLRIDYDNYLPANFKAYSGENPVVSSGYKIENWTIENKNGQIVWKAVLPHRDEGKWDFKQLFVNGNRATVARLPKSGYFIMDGAPNTDLSTYFAQGSTSFYYKEDDLGRIENLTGADVVLLHYWVSERMPIIEQITEKNLIVSSRKSMFSMKVDNAGTGYAKYYVENFKEALTQEGEWYLDSKASEVYYIPKQGETLENTEIIAPMIEHLVEVVGNPSQNQYIENISFDGITFIYSDWRQPNGGFDVIEHDAWRLDKNVDYAASLQAASNTSGAIYFEGAKRCSVANCSIKHIGLFGIELADGCFSNEIAGNTINDIGAGAIKLNGSNAFGALSNRNGCNIISGNEIYDSNHVFFGAPAILSKHSFNNCIEKNHIHNTRSFGISTGWVWGYDENVSKGNIIRKNHIHHLGGGVLNDFGAIYTLGMQPGTVISENLIHDIQKDHYGSAGIYLDEGSSYIVVENNICYNVYDLAFTIHYGKENIIRNNIFAFSNSGIAGFSVINEKTNNIAIFINNIVITDNQYIFAGNYGTVFKDKKLISNNNIFYCTKELELVMGIYKGHVKGFDNILTFKEWQDMGYDTNSKITKPDFYDIDNFDFRLKTSIEGFKEINLIRLDVKK